MYNKKKEPVRLRMRRTADGGQSLYLDIYVKGKRTYEYLHLYLLPEHTAADRRANNDTLGLAEAVRAKRLVELRNGIYGFANVNNGSKTAFFAYLTRVIDGYSGATQGSWTATLRHLRHYEPRDITFADITPDWVQQFKDYLAATPLQQNTKHLYFCNLHTCLARAVREGIIRDDPSRNVQGFATIDTPRHYLTVDELHRLSQTDIRNDTVKRAFLFSCLTGLRWSDIAKLQWEEVHDEQGYTRLIFTQRKTGQLEYLDLNPQAAALLGTRTSGTVFHDLCTLNRANVAIKQWMQLAGIDKHISFHCGRHTFAVMMLDLGVDIYTVSKLLGHKKLTTTQVYAKVLDKNKRNAIERIPTIL